MLRDFTFISLYQFFPSFKAYFETSCTLPTLTCSLSLSEVKGRASSGGGSSSKSSSSPLSLQSRGGDAIDWQSEGQDHHHSHHREHTETCKSTQDQQTHTLFQSVENSYKSSRELREEHLLSTLNHRVAQTVAEAKTTLSLSAVRRQYAQGKRLLSISKSTPRSVCQCQCCAFLPLSACMAIA